MDIWFIAWIVTYIMFLGLAYVAYVSKIVKRLTKPDYHHYHIIDTGESGDFVFKEGENNINGKTRVFARERIFKGTLFYLDGNAEPLNIKAETGLFKYWCDTKNFDTIARNDILETLLILRAKDLLMLLIIGSAVVLLLAVVGNWYLTHNTLDSMQNTLATIQNNTAPTIVKVR